MRRACAMVRDDSVWCGCWAARPIQRLATVLAPSIFAVTRRARAAPVKKGMQNPGIAVEATSTAFRVKCVSRGFGAACPHGQ